ncbi:MAG: hypothetical protein HY000_13510 [Planctomycetes bacterium]|nr:hypothetical protein [Planctomycetota bacterium]
MISTEVVDLVNALLPGFLAAWIFYGLTAHPRKDAFERTVQAPIFTAIVHGFTILLREVFLLLGRVASLATWTSDVNFVWSLLVATVFGFVVAGFTNNNTLHCFLWNRRWNLTRRPADGLGKGWVWTKRTAFPGEWYSALHQEDHYLVLHLKGNRRLYGWAEEWPDQAEFGHFVITEPEWLLDDNQSVPVDRVARLVIPATEVEALEFVKNVDELSVDSAIIAQRERLLISLHQEKGNNGEQVSAAVAESKQSQLRDGSEKRATVSTDRSEASSIKELLARRPFSPFRVILSSGDSYEVRHPEFALLLKGGLYIGLPAEGGTSGGNGEANVPERAVFCSALHLAGVEQLVGK